MSESSQRVKEWRKRHSEHGLKAMTIWFPEEQKARLEDLAKAWRRSTSELLLEAFTQFNPVSLPVTATVADTAQLQALIQDALVHAPAVTAYVTALVTDTVTATLTRDLPVLVRQLVEGLAREALGVPVTVANSDVTETEPPGEGTTHPPSRQEDGSRYPSSRGHTHIGQRKLTPRQVRALRDKRRRGVPIPALMEEYGLSRASVFRYLQSEKRET
jgi:predicted transcriptional regulator